MGADDNIPGFTASPNNVTRSKEKFYLVKNYELKAKSITHFFFHSVELEPHTPEELKKASGFTISIRDYVQGMRADIESHFMTVGVYKTGEDGSCLAVMLTENLVRDLGSLLLLPYLLMQGSIQWIDGAGSPQNLPFDECIPLSGRPGLRWSILDGLPVRGDIFTGTITVNAMIGWHEPDGKGIKLGANSFMQNLLHSEASKDLTIVAGENGAKMKCHRIVFAAHSLVFEAMVSPDNGMKEGQSGIVEMKENSEEGVVHLLRYLYCSEVETSELSCEVTAELFKTAHKYELTHLEICLRELFLQKEGKWYGANVVLELYYYVRNLEGLGRLRDHLLRIMTGMSGKLRSCDRFNELSRDEAVDLLWKLFDLKKPLGTSQPANKSEK